MRRNKQQWLWRVAAIGGALALSACSSQAGDPNSLGGSGTNDQGNSSGNGSGSGDNGSASGSGSNSGGGEPVAAGTGNNGDNNNPTPGGGTPGTGTSGSGGTTGGNGSDPGTATNPNIDQRVINYGEAYRSASLKLVGALPTLADINKLATAAATDQKALYEGMIDTLLADPRFAVKQIQWWRDTLKTGNQGTPAKGMPSFDTAATFAASVVVQDRPYTDLFTATTGTCPTYANGAFTAASCTNGAPTAGLLSDPGLMAQYFANLAFRRTRFLQETFVCSKFPAEFSATPVAMGSGTYTSPWPFTSITGGTTAKVNFQDTSAVICANCHTTMNHIAPLFANFDATGTYKAGAIQVLLPTAGTPVATLNDWLPAGMQTFAWRNGKTVTDLPSLGAAVAADPDVARCAVNRIWNFAMSRGDIVNDLATIPPVVTDALLTDFTTNGMKMKRLIKNAFTSDDYVKF